MGNQATEMSKELREYFNYSVRLTAWVAAILNPADQELAR